MHGLKFVGDHQCKYQYSDESFCGYSTIHDYYDQEKKDYCIFHTRNDNKLKAMRQVLEIIILEKNHLVLEEIKNRNLTEEKNRKEINEIRNKNLIVLEGAYFPNEFRLLSNPKKTQIESEITFYNSIFKGKFFPLNTVFKGKASFISANFDNLANFSDVIFQGDASFRSTHFNNTILFINTIFKEKADFFSANFSGVTEFFGAQFEQKAEFLEASFNKSAIFKSSIFSKEADFARVMFFDVDFKETIFRGESNFHDTTFTNYVSFRYTIFLSKTNYENVVFKKNVDFRGSVFKAGSNFQYMKSYDLLDFSFALFIGGTINFSYASFKPDNTYFNQTIFNCTIIFSNMLLRGVYFTRCYLGCCLFQNSDIRDAVFINCSWEKNYPKVQFSLLLEVIKLIESKLKIYEDFSDIKIFNPGHLPEHKTRKIILYDEICHSRKKMKNDPSVIENIKRFYFKYSIYFNNLLFILIGILIINHFPNMNSAIIELYIVSYIIICSYLLIKKQIKKKREGTTLYRIDQPNQEVERILDNGLLEGMYCQFKLNLDNNKSYSQANEFYFCEKLWERKKLFNETGGKPMWFFLWSYWALNGYGNRPVRTIINFALLLLVLSWSLLQLGLIDKTISNEKKSSNSLCYVIPLNLGDKIYFDSIQESLACIEICALPIVLWKHNDFYQTAIANILKYKTLYIDRLSSFLIFYNSYIEQNKSRESKITIIDILDVSLWNLSVSPGNKTGDYSSKNLIKSKIFIFFIQWLFRPFMVAMVIISVRRKIQRH